MQTAQVTKWALQMGGTSFPLFMVPFSLTLVFLFVFERIIHAILSLLLAVEPTKTGAPSYALSTLAARGVLGGVVNVIASTVFAGITLISNTLSIISSFLVWFLVVFVVLSLVWVTYEEYPVVWIHAATFYNTRIGPLLYAYAFVPLEVVSLFLKALLPIYNGVVYINTYMVTHGLFPMLWDQTQAFVEMCMALLQLGKACAVSLERYVSDSSCDTLDRCLSTPRDLDLITPMDSVRSLGVVAVSLFGNVCGLFRVPVQLLLFPLFDEKLATAVHNMVNAVLHLFIQIPTLTVRRSAAAPLGNGLNALQSTPDFEPFWTRLVAGIKDWGAMMDNWFNFGVSLALGDTSADCGIQAWSASGSDGAVVPSSGAEFFANSGALGGQTAVVGLTDWLMATSNGTNAYFYGHNSNVSTPAVWPVEVDVSLGLAAVTYSEAGGNSASDASVHSHTSRPGSRTTTDIMGCNCLDSSTGIQVVCAIIRYGYTAASSLKQNVFSVYFQDTTWVKDFTCASVEISVRSVRWPVTRYEGSTTPFAGGNTQIPANDCINRGTCESVDATIWLVPKCTSPDLLLHPQLCSTIDGDVGTNCFPYCMAARVAGSANQNPVFTNANTWQTGKHLLGIDCLGLHTTTQDSSLAASSSFGARKLAVLNAVSPLFSGSSAVSESDPLFVTSVGGSPVLGCRSARSSGTATVQSWIDDASVSVPYIRARGQPFAITGDTALLGVKEPSSDTQHVLVERLTGDQRNVYSMRAAPMALPAAPAPPDLTPSMQTQNASESHVLLVPFAFQESRILATSSRNYVFYVMQPPLRLFSAYFDWCASEGRMIPQFQLMMLSSYTPLVVYRVRAYCQANCETDLSSSFVFDNFASGGFNAKTFGATCSRRFNTTAVSMDYINEQNIAIVLQECDARLNLTYSVPLCMDNPVYVTYWLNPASMEVRRGIPWPLATPSLQSSPECTGLRTIPKLGKMAGSVSIGTLYIIKFVTDGFVYTPGVIAHWREGGACGLNSMGHSVIASCDDNYLSLDDYFDSAGESVQIFWGIAQWIANVLKTNEGAANPLSSWLLGTASVGIANGVEPSFNAGEDVVTLLTNPVSNHVLRVATTMQTQTFWTAGLGTSVALLEAPSFWYRVTRQLVTDTVKRMLYTDGSTVPSPWRDFLDAMYTGRVDWDNKVMLNAQNGCEGVSILLGGNTSPWALLAKHTCLNGVMLVDGLYKFLLAAFVDVPLIKCVCKDSQGNDQASYAISTCIPQVPSNMRPIIFGMVAVVRSGGKQGPPLCARVLGYTRDAMVNSMAPWFSSIYDGMDALGSSVDYVMKGFDDDAGQCLNYQHNPDVVVIVPEPVDYFQACGKTTSCQSKCIDEWTQFQAALSGQSASSLVGSRVMTQSVESKFFPSPTGAITAPGEILALTEVVEEQTLCQTLCRNGNDRCLAAALSAGTALWVQYFCIPISPGASVYASETGNLWDLGVSASDVSQIGFINGNGTSVVVLTAYDGGSLIIRKTFQAPDFVMLNVSLNDPTTMPLFILLGLKPAHISSIKVIREWVLADVAVRQLDPTTQQWMAKTHSVFVSTQQDMMLVVPASLAVSAYQGYVTCEVLPHRSPTSASLLMWPTKDGLSPMQMELDWGSYRSLVGSPVPYTIDSSLESQLSSQGMLSKQMILSKTTTSGSQSGQLLVLVSFSGKTYDWLSQLVLTQRNSGVVSSSLLNSQRTAISINVETRCDGTDCRGCPNLNLRALCTNYQRCAIFRCVGTPINVNRPLCAVGLSLRATGMLTAETMRGAWNTLIQTFVLFLRLDLTPPTTGSTLRADGTEQNKLSIEYFDDAFFGHVCAYKDLTGELVSIATSLMNGVLQQVHVPISAVRKVAVVDSAVHITMNMVAVSFTGFMQQVLLFPTYGLLIMHKTMTCQLQGVINMLEPNGYSLTISSTELEAATDQVTGSCLVQSTQTMSAENYIPASSSRLGKAAGTMMAGMGNALISSYMEPVVHTLDGTLTWAIGVVRKFATVLQAGDVRNCIAPDMTLSLSVKCACNDTNLTIPDTRAEEGLSQRAHWCTGTLALVDYQGMSQIIYNPYTFDELRAMLGARKPQATNTVLDAYLACASVSTTLCDPPIDPLGLFEAQGIGLLPVFTRCRQNFVNSQWDPGAYVMYDNALLAKYIKGGLDPQAAQDDGSGLSQCLLQSAAAGEGNKGCMDLWMQFKGYSELYWTYSELTPTESSAYKVDGCKVFSGPAGRSDTMGDITLKNPFVKCSQGLTDATDGGLCDLSPLVWSPTSGNQVPVASMHTMSSNVDATRTQSNFGSRIPAVVELMYQRAREMVINAALPLTSHNNPNLKYMLFSAEGDAIHQLMDCVYQGPYARMDYWPVPRDCDPSLQDDCLVGPYWSRDENAGRSRKIDIENCGTTQEIPFTCGSPTRKALIHNFVSYVSEAGNTNENMVGRYIQNWATALVADWGNVSNYGCVCPDQTTKSANCCPPDNDTAYLPPELGKTFTYIQSASIMSMMELVLKKFYEETMTRHDHWIQNLDATELPKYDWTSVAGSKRVVEEARFDTYNPTMKYNKDEAMSPPVNNSMQLLWHNCHGALSQLLFSLPVDPNTGSLWDQETQAGFTDVMTAFSGGDISVLADLVTKLTHNAFLSSPLYRHYHTRHHPSNSTLCLNESEGDYSDDPGIRGSVTFSDYKVGADVLLEGRGFASIPVRGVLSGTIGRYSKACFCGWPKLKGRCQVPAQVCAALWSSPDILSMSLAPNCSYPQNRQNRSLLNQFVSNASWCPELQLSDQMGFMDRASTEQWLRGTVNLTTSLDAVLRYGASGLKVGNLPLSALGTPRDPEHGQDLRETISAGMSPGGGQNPDSAVLHSCNAHRRIEASNNFLVSEFVDELFPMAQGITDATPNAYCMRYVIEQTRLVVLELLLNNTPQDSTDHTRLTVQVTNQKHLASRWRTRCGSQVQLVSLCKALDLYRPNVFQYDTCNMPWAFNLQSGSFQPQCVYITPNCLLGVANSTTSAGCGSYTYYDICQCNPDMCKASTPRFILSASNANLANCRAILDPRTFVRGEEMAWWAQDLEGTYSSEAQKWNDWLSDPVNLLDLDSFVDSTLRDASSFGNTPPTASPQAGAPHWAVAEGFMTAAETATFCDMVADYWPDEAVYPIGYHPTLPSDAGDRAYRGFDNVFALDSNGNMVYYEDQTRFASHVDSSVNAGGLCRSAQFGFDMSDANTIRVCTSVASNLEQTDIHVPRRTNIPTPVFETATCSQLSTDLPWTSLSDDYNYYDPGFYTVGTVPNMPPQASTSSTYPADPTSLWPTGPLKKLQTQGWGDACSDVLLPNCASNADCPSQFYCKQTLQGGVCLDPGVDCTSHEDCYPSGKMCTGEGVCAFPMVSVLNTLSTENTSASTAFRAFTTECSGTASSMKGASHWGYVPDLLETHGLCSYKDWVQYRLTVEKCGGNVQTDADGNKYYMVNGSCLVYLLDPPASAPSFPYYPWWNSSGNIPYRMRLIPTHCDRDYERFSLNGKEMKACAPTQTQVRMVNSKGASYSNPERDQVFSSHIRDATSSGGVPAFPLGQMPKLADKTYGFTGLDNVTKTNPPSFVSCSQIHQCFADVFTVNGNQKKKDINLKSLSQGYGINYLSRNLTVPDRTLRGGAAYDPQDIFVCGIMGYVDKGTTPYKCRLDTRVLPIYDLFCTEKTPPASCSLQVSSTKYTPVNIFQMDDTCANTPPTYDPDFHTLNDVLVPTLTSLFAAFNRPGTLEEHGLLIDCMNDIYGEMTNTSQFAGRGLYFPFPFTLYEIPFSWFYQCIVLRGGALPDTKLVKTQCAQYSVTPPNTPGSQYTSVSRRSSDSIMTYLATMRGGYPTSYVKAYASSMYSIANRTLAAAVNSVVSKYFPAGDQTFPKCYKTKNWKQGADFATNIYVQDCIYFVAIETHCQSSELSRAVSRYNAHYGTKIDDTITGVAEELTEPDENTLTSMSLPAFGVEAPEIDTKETTGFKSLLWQIRKFARQQLELNMETARLTVADVNFRNTAPVTYNWSLPAADSAEFEAFFQKTIVSKTAYWNLNQPVDEITVSAATGNHLDSVQITLNLVQAATAQSADVVDFQTSLPFYKTTTASMDCKYDTWRTLDGETVTLNHANFTAATETGEPYTALVKRYATKLYQAVLSEYTNAMLEIAPTSIYALPPTNTPFFTDEKNTSITNFSTSFSGFDLTHVKAYEININPNPLLPTMCVLGAQEIHFETCTNLNFLALQSHGRKHFLTDGPPIVSPLEQLNWVVSPRQMEEGAIYGYANTTRDQRQRFYWSLFDSSVCTSNTLNSMVCRQDNNFGSYSPTSAINPWPNGHWNPYVGCDVKLVTTPSGWQEAVDAHCSVEQLEDVCSTTTDSGSYYDYMTTAVQNQNSGTICRELNGRFAAIPNVAKSEYNLCSHELKENGNCIHDQGMVGGTDGVAQEATSARDMYTSNPFDSNPLLSSNGIYGPNPNPLLSGMAGGVVNYGFIQIPRWHIGGHVIGMEIVPFDQTETGQWAPASMWVKKLPLKSVPDNTQIPDWPSQDVDAWVPTLKEAINSDHYAYQRTTLATWTDENNGWDCPLRRRAFYSGGVEQFGPSLPSARRSNRLFGNITAGLFNQDTGILAHPTQKRDSARAFFGGYNTTNGFCFCPVGPGISSAHCMIQISDKNTSNCSLWNTIQTLKGSRWAWSHTFKPYTKTNVPSECSLQLDWPFFPGTLRDGSTTSGSNAWTERASDPRNQQCHVLDRMPEFKYTYRADNKLRQTFVTNLQQGPCHTGRVQQGQPTAASGRCVKKATAPAFSSIQCDRTTQSFTANKPSKKSPQTLAGRVRRFRQQCTDWAPLPNFTTRSGTPLQQPESSFGMPYRVSTERMLAADLLKALCNGIQDCTQTILNPYAWRKGSFMRAYLKDPASLFAPGVVSPPDKPAKPATNDDKLWSNPDGWAYCPSTAALRLGKNCTGSILKSDWRADKVGTCFRTIQQSLKGGPDPMAATSVCNVDAAAGNMCSVLQEAQAIVAAANCLASGNKRCSIKEYVYNPSTWDTSNQEWVRQSVDKYYRSVDGCPRDDGSCICPVEIEISAIQQANNNILQRCPAVPVAAFANILVSMRDMVQVLATLAMHVTDMAVQTLSILVNSNSMTVIQNAKEQARLDYNEIRRIAQPAIDQGSDILMDMVLFSGTLGPWLVGNGASACDTINSAITYVKKLWCQFVVGWFPNFLQAMDNGMTWVEIGFITVNDVFDVLLYGFMPEAFAALAGIGYVNGFSKAQYAVKQSALSAYQSVNLGAVTSDIPFRAGDRITVDENGNLKAMTATGDAINAEKRAKDAGLVEKFTMGKAKALSSIGNILGKFSTIGEVAMLGYGIYEIIDSADKERKIKEALDQFPSSWTVFDFTQIHIQISNILNLFANDVMCMDADNMQFLDCDSAKHRLKALDSKAVTALVPSPSQCWAEAQTQQLGVINLYACTASSTCAQPGSSELILCAECPASSDPLLNTFGCDTMMQQCSCGVQKMTVTQCISHNDCLGPKTTCNLLSGVDDLSFGTHMCSMCSQKPICLISSSTFSGQCTCLSSGTAQVDRCSQQGVERITTNPSRLCGFSTLSTPDPYLQWGELALVLCSNVLSATCVQVFTDTSGSILVPVAFSAASVLSSSASTSSRRLLWNRLDVDTARTSIEHMLTEANTTSVKAYLLQQARTLQSPFAHEPPEDDIPPTLIHSTLMENETGWNTTASPCSQLVFAYQNGEHLGPTDDRWVKQCAYWRIVARKIINKFNLSTTVPDTLLLSVDDFATSLGKQGVLESLRRNPFALMEAALHLPWVKPLRAILRATGLTRKFITERLAASLKRPRAHRGETRPDPNHETRPDPNHETRPDPNHETRPDPNHTPGTSNSQEHPEHQVQPDKKTHTANQTHQHNVTHPEHGNHLNKTHPYNRTEESNQSHHKHGRNLMSVLSDTLTKLYENEYSNGSLTVSLPSERQAAIGGQQDTTPSLIQMTLWPETIHFDPSDNTCPFIDAGLIPLQDVLKVLQLYYTHFNDIQAIPPPPQDIEHTVPNLRADDTAAASTSDTFSTSPLLSLLISPTGIRPVDITQFLADQTCDTPETETCSATNRWTLAYIISSTTTCDFRAINLCTKHSHDLLYTAIMFLIIYMVIAKVCTFLGLSMLSNLLFYSLPILIVWHSFGLSPSCLPMIPPCLMDDVITTVSTILPASIQFPPLLLCSTPGVGGCLPSCATSTANGTDTLTCLKSCTAVGFTSWQDPVEYLAAELGAADTLSNNDFFSLFSVGLQAKKQMVASPDRPAYRMCACITAVSSLPVILVLVATIAVTCSLVTFIAGLGPSMVNLLWSIVVFDHTATDPVMTD